jgi:DNA-binding response OmpR family regulator
MNDATRSTRETRPRRLICLLSTLNPDRGLSVALRQNLAEVLPEIDFTLDPRDAVDAVWVCGYEPGRRRLVQALRQHHSAAILVVTGRDPAEDWEQEVLSAGADVAFSWPVAYEVLQAVLRGGQRSPSVRSR